MKTVMFLLLAIVSNAFAGTQSSAKYLVPSDVIDGGGSHCASANYSIDSSIDTVGGLVVSGAAQVTNRSGYAGQLYEPTSLTLTAPNTNLNEGTSVPVSAVQFLDDGTVSLANSFAKWSFVGPISSINSEGVVTAAEVNQNTPASVTATLDGQSASLNLIVIYTGVPPSYNELTAQLLSGGNVRFSFVGSNGMSYVLERSYNLLPPVNWVPQMTNTAAMDGSLVFTNLANSATNNFWRVRLVP